MSVRVFAYASAPVVGFSKWLQMYGGRPTHWLGMMGERRRKTLYQSSMLRFSPASSLPCFSLFPSEGQLANPSQDPISAIPNPRNSA